MPEYNRNGVSITLASDPANFSPNQIDEGTIRMIDHVTLSIEDKVIDLGCGYGFVGIWAAKQIPPEQVYMTDIDQRAVIEASKNVELNHAQGVTVVCGDAYTAIPCADFSVILSNPPYHTDFSVAKRFIEKGFNRLRVGGKMYMVTKRKEWYQNKFISVFGGVHIWPENGYYVFMAEKKSKDYSSWGKKK